jgi:hypothetical protein
MFSLKGARNLGRNISSNTEARTLTPCGTILMQKHSLLAKKFRAFKGEGGSQPCWQVPTIGFYAEIYESKKNLLKYLITDN